MKKSLETRDRTLSDLLNKSSCYIEVEKWVDVDVLIDTINTSLNAANQLCDFKTKP